MPEPSWNTPARLNGLRPASWKKRTGVTRDGTMAEMVELWLSQPDHVKQDCDIGWGPNEQGHSGSLGAQALARYVERRKLPPQMAARYTDADAALRQLLSLAQPAPCDPKSILTAAPTTPSQYAHMLASKKIRPARMGDLRNKIRKQEERAAIEAMQRRLCPPSPVEGA